MDQPARNPSNRRTRVIRRLHEVGGATCKTSACSANLSHLLSTVTQLAQPPTILLNLPDDVLHLIMEEVYDEQYNSSNVPLQIATILINKRIFSLAQSIWFRHLSIDKWELDLQLSNLHLHDARRTALRHLSLAFAEPYPNLFKSVLLRLPLLTHLTVQVPYDLTPQASSGLIHGIASLTSLKHLTLQAENKRKSKHLTQLYNDCIQANPRGEARISLERDGVSFHDFSLKRGTNLKCLIVQSTSSLIPRDRWRNLFSLELHNGEEALKWDDRFLEAFRDAITHEVSLVNRLSSLRVLTVAVGSILHRKCHSNGSR